MVLQRILSGRVKGTDLTPGRADERRLGRHDLIVGGSWKPETRTRLVLQEPQSTERGEGVTGRWRKSTSLVRMRLWEAGAGQKEKRLT